jgi:hypothetical protein
MTINEYEIGGICVRMTAEMAARWNAGDWTDADDIAARVAIPDQYEQGSSLRDGFVVMHSPRLIKASEEITMKEAFERGIHSEYMEGMPSNLLREDV